jgi:hypothetical protein
MKIEAGKYYRTRDGWKVGPMLLAKDAHLTCYRWTDRDNSFGKWDDTGEDGHATSFEDSIDDLIAEWTDEPAPKLWKDMTDEERVDALYDGLKGCPPGTTGKDRIKLVLSSLGEVRPEPKRETVTLTGANFGTANLAEWKWSFRQSGHIGQETHRITFDLIDGEPDPSTIRMESL